jgi:hypothetical protein
MGCYNHVEWREVFLAVFLLWPHYQVTGFFFLSLVRKETEQKKKGTNKIFSAEYRFVLSIQLINLSHALRIKRDLISLFY